MTQFTTRLKGLAKSSGKTQVAIAGEIGLSPQELSYFIHGREPCYEKLVRIADYFGVSCDYLLGHERKPEYANVIMAEKKDFAEVMKAKIDKVFEEMINEA